MLYLTLIRHAKSSWADPEMRDFDRPLNERGLINAPVMARYLARHLPAPDCVLVSDAKRTQMTAAFFMEAFQLPSDRLQLKSELYEASMTNLLDILAALPESNLNVWLIGHNPGITRLHTYLTSPALDNIPTCGISHIAIERESWSGLPVQCGRSILYATPKSL